MKEAENHENSMREIEYSIVYFSLKFTWEESEIDFVLQI
jgi:hypothetical protein